MCSRKDASKGPFIKKIRKSNDLQKQQLSMLCSLPGVGEKTAIRMLEKFGTPLRVLSSSIIELSKVSGLGEARAKNIKKVLQAQSKHLKKISQKTLHDT
jgi:DNA excision repair protein ERCC-4